MTADEFRRIALGFAGAVEASHMNHPDFRVNGRIFATLGSPDAQHGMVKLPVEAQHAWLQSAPEAFTPAAGAWGRGGCTLVRLAAAAPAQIEEAMASAWEIARQNRSRSRASTTAGGKHAKKRAN